MVGVIIQCRLGNQLFQYAFIAALAKRKNVSFFLNDKFESLLLRPYFDLKHYHPFANTIKQYWFKLRSGKYLKSLNAIEIHRFDELDRLEDNKIYSGFFQSDLYFQEINQEIKDFISVKKKFVRSFQHKFGKLFYEHKTIAVHIRRGDYLELNYWWQDNLGDTNLALDDQYYRTCLAQVENLKEYRVLFISDDITYAEKQFNDIEQAIFVSNEMIIDFQILQNADICILSNSSFSWWGAYLNSKANKKVFCPENWLGFKIGREFPPGIINQDWQKVSV